MLRSRLAPLVLALGLLSGRAAAGPAWEPARTWVFMVGILEFQDAVNYPPFSKEGRLDTRLLQVLKKRGVPAERVVYLQDRQATLARIRSELAGLLERTGEGDTLLFEYFGHGARGEDSRGYFIAHDTRGEDLPATGWSMASVAETIRKGFRGSRALLTADSCFSGALARVVRENPGGSPLPMAALTSSLSSEISTERWTFTECLVDGFAGRGYADLDGDGKIRLDELADYTKRELAFSNHQFSDFAVAGGFDGRTVVAPARALKHADIGKRLEAEDQGKWYRVKVVRVGPKGKWKIHYVGWDRKYDEWLAPGSPRLREPVLTTYSPGAPVDVRWKGDWYAATVLKQELGLHYIHYRDDGDEWDEWVAPDRIRPRTE